MLLFLRRWRGGGAVERPSPEMEDGRLIELASEGSLDAFNMLVDRHRDAVYGVALRYMRSPDLADDVTQDTFIRAYDALESFRNDNGRGFRSWLLRIASNRALDVLRYENRRPAGSLDAVLEQADSTWEPEDQQPTPVQRVERQALGDLLEAALATLPEDQRLAVILYDVEGYSYEEIAEITGAAAGTVKSRLHRGRARLREVLRDDPHGRELLGDLARLSSGAGET